MSRIKVSVCISVYNGEEYLQRCLDSVYYQTLESLEIIVVNDGSTDNSEAILRQYAQTHKNRDIIILSQDNKGLALGRQMGIRHSSGEYIAFIDVDDTVIDYAYEVMLNCAEKYKADIVEAQTNKNGKILSSSLAGVHNSHDILHKYFKGGYKISPMLWLRLYHHSLFKQQVLPQIYTNHEDIFTFPCLLYVARTVYFINQCVHTYSIENENSVTHDQSYDSKKKDLLLEISAICHFSQFVGSSELRDYLEDLDVYKARKCNWFLFSRLKGVSLQDKAAFLMSAYGFSTQSELFKFSRTHAPFLFNINGLVKIFGVRIAYLLYFLLNRIKE